MITKCPCRSERVHDGNEGSIRVMEGLRGSWKVHESHGVPRRFNASPVGFMVEWSINVLVFP